MKIKLTTQASTSSYGQPMFVIDDNAVDYDQGIRAVRSKYGLNTKELGEICGVSSRTVEDWEQIRRIPSKPSMLLLAVWIDSQK